MLRKMGRFSTAPFQTLITPGEPIHGIVRVLKQVGRFFRAPDGCVPVNAGFHITYEYNKRNPE